MAQTNDDDLLILSDETTGVDENKITDNLTELLNTDNVVSGETLEKVNNNSIPTSDESTNNGISGEPDNSFSLSQDVPSNNTLSLSPEDIEVDKSSENDVSSPAVDISSSDPNDTLDLSVGLDSNSNSSTEDNIVFGLGDTTSATDTGALLDTTFDNNSGTLLSDNNLDSDSGNLQDILGEAIVKLENRKSRINSEISTTLSEVKDLKSQISDLEKQVQAKNDTIEGLRAENSRILKDVATLGRMKTEEKTTLTKSVKPKVVKPKPTKTK